MPSWQDSLIISKQASLASRVRRHTTDGHVPEVHVAQSVDNGKAHTQHHLGMRTINLLSLPLSQAYVVRDGVSWLHFNQAFPSAVEAESNVDRISWVSLVWENSPAR